MPPAPASPTKSVQVLDYMEEDQATLFLEYWRILRRRKGPILLLACIGLLAAVLVTLPQTPVYQARTTLEIQDLNQEFMNLKQVSPVMEPTGVDSVSNIETQIKILQSDALARRTVTKLRNGWWNSLKFQKLQTSGEPHSRDPKEGLKIRDKMLANAARSMKIRAAGQTRIIEILINSTDAQLASAFANTLVSEFIDQNMEARLQMSRRTHDLLARQLEEMRLKLERSEDALQRYARRNALIFTGDKQNVEEDRLRQLQAELLRAEAYRVEKQSRYEAARTAQPDAIAEAAKESNLRELQAKLNDAKREEAELAVTFRPDYSKAKKTRAKVAALESALERERRQIMERIEYEYSEAQRSERLLNQVHAAQVLAVARDSERAIHYNMIRRDVDTNRQIYEAIIQRVKDTDIAAATKASNFRVIDAASVPTMPYRPNWSLNATIGVVAGFMVGIVVVVTRERNDRSLQSPGDASFHTGLPELGIVPSACSASRLFPQRGKRRVGAGWSGLLLQALGRRRDPDSLVSIAGTDYHSPIADGFRTIVVSLLSPGSRLRAVVVSSPHAGEGKTTVAANLAIALAQIDQKVLLIDGDLRKPRLHHIFNLDNNDGLIDILRSHSVDDNAAEESLCESGIPNLHILPSGRSLSPLPNLLFSRAMPVLLARLRKRYDFVIIDTPPILNMPDARVLGRISDGVIMVVRAGHTTRDEAIVACRQLAQDHARAVGVVLNDWNPKCAPDRYYAYYSAEPARSTE